MGCFVVTTVEAIAVSAYKAIRKHSLKKRGIKDTDTKDHVSMDKKLSYLNIMLWGGSILLLLEHIWHGEVVPWFPFFTAMESKKETIEMLREMSTIGVSMALVVTGVWAIICMVLDLKHRKECMEG